MLQQQGQAQPEEADSGITRGRAGLGMLHRPIRALNAETSPIPDKDFGRRPHPFKQDIGQPVDLALSLFVAEGARHEDPANPSPIAEGVGRGVALAPATQGPHTALFAANGTGPTSRGGLRLPVADELGGTKACVERQAVPAQTAGDDALQQALEDGQPPLSSSYITHRQRQAPIAPNHVDTRPADEVRCARWSGTPTPLTFEG